MSAYQLPSTSSITFLDLPDDVVNHIVSHLQGRTLLRIGSICKRLKEYISDDEYFQRRCHAEISAFALGGYASWKQMYAAHWSDFYREGGNFRVGYYTRAEGTTTWKAVADGNMSSEIVCPVQLFKYEKCILTLAIPCKTELILRSGTSVQWKIGDMRHALTFKEAYDAKDAMFEINKWLDAGVFWYETAGVSEACSTLCSPAGFLSLLRKHVTDRSGGKIPVDYDITTSDIQFILEIASTTLPTFFTFKDFLVFADWFGPLVTSQSRLKRFFHNIDPALDCVWFHGFQIRDVSELLLRSEPEGTFLLRCSTTHRMCFAVSFVYKHKIRHSLIRQEGPRAFQLQDSHASEFVESTLQSLVAHVNISLNRPFPRRGRQWLRSPIGTDMAWQDIRGSSAKSYISELHSAITARNSLLPYWTLRPNFPISDPPVEPVLFKPSEILPKHTDRIRIGTGSFGAVYLGASKGYPIAVKRIADQSLVARTGVGVFRSQVALLQRIPSHVNLVSLLGGCVEFPDIALVWEHFPDCVSLHQMIHNDGFQLSLPQKLIIACDIAAGVAHLHANGTVHRDLRSSNVLIDRNMIVKVTDYGFGWMKMRAACDYAPGLFRYLPPEMFPVNTSTALQDQDKALVTQYTPAVDVYSFGLILHELLTENPPFHQQSDRHLFVSQSSGRSTFYIDETIREDLILLISSCVSPVADQRPSMRVVEETLQQAKRL